MIELNRPAFTIKDRCPHCGLEGQRAILHRYHFDKCPVVNPKKVENFTCLHCSELFTRIAKPGFVGVFCSRKCAGAYKGGRYGKANPNFVEQSNARAAGQFTRNRIKALERDGHKCVRCKSTHRLQVHHIDPWEPGQEDPHRLDNLETLCHKCHVKEHWEIKGEVEKAEFGRMIANARWSKKQ
jgi:hypothetical protein